MQISLIGLIFGSVLLANIARTEGSAAFDFATRTYTLPDGWVDLGEVNDNDSCEQDIKIIFALKHQNETYLEELFWNVTDPNSPQYGQWRTVDQVAEIVMPHPDHINAVESWLKTFHWNKVIKTTAKDLITIHISVCEAEKAFRTKFRRYAYQGHPGREFIRTMGYTVPQEVGEALDEITGLLPRGHHMTVQAANVVDNRRRQSPQGPPITPDVIMKTYGIDYIATNPKTTQAIASFQQFFFSPNDLSKFQSTFHVKETPVMKVVGQNDPDFPGDEASLDVQYIMAVGQGVETWVVYQDDFFSLIDWISGQIDTDDSPWVHSMSYGDTESGSSLLENINNLNKQFMKFGVMGRTILVASGDSGVGCTRTGSPFIPIFPTSSPYVTSVGGTDGASLGWSNSGGGFSNAFSRPSYQDSAVENFFKSAKDLPDSSFYNSRGRGYPDVSAFATNFRIIQGGEEIVVSGTSASTPTFAGIVSLLNDVRFNNGGQPLGFLNPLLYKMAVDDPNTFTQITEGNNGLGIDSNTCPGFDAIAGWNPVTGLGTPNFQAMADYVKNNGNVQTPQTSHHLSDSAIAGIVIGGVVGLAILAFIAWRLCHRNRAPDTAKDLPVISRPAAYRT
eukprot:Clim_evm2s60 gene=Clim_evmTU2s60